MTDIIIIATDTREIVEISPADIIAAGSGWYVAHGQHWCDVTGQEMNGNRKAEKVA